MSRICQLTGKSPLTGHHVSHSNRKTNRFFYPNLQTKRVFVAEIGKWIVVKLAAKALRTMNKLGPYQYLKQQLALGFDPQVWCEDPTTQTKEASQRGYRRVAVEDKQGNVTYKITYEAPNQNTKKVKLSSLIK